MKIAIVDDDLQMHERLQTYLNEMLGDNLEISCFTSGEQFLSVWDRQTFDLVILDIFMDKLNGMEVARKIRSTDKNVRIVFSTTSNEFASESYEVNACYYLHKPFGKDRIKDMLDRLNMAKMEQMRTVILPDESKVILRDVIYADFAAHRVNLHCKNEKNLIVRSSFSEIEPLFCAYPYFLSPSKGIIVNLYEVKSQTSDTFVMSSGDMIPISRRRSKEVLEAYSSFRFNELRKGSNI